VPPFTLSSLESKHPFDHGDKYDPNLVFHGARITMSYRHTKFSLYRTGTVLSRASRSPKELDKSFSWLSSFLSRFNLQLSDKYDIINIAAVSDFFCSFDLSALADYLPPEFSYDPFPELSDKDDREHLFDFITYHFHDTAPRYTALIFPTGKVIFIGFKSIPVLESHAHELSSFLSELSLNHPEVLVK